MSLLSRFGDGKRAAPVADVCLLLEGSYPYVAGGVSSWTHDLIRAQSDLDFHIVSLMPGPKGLERRYDLPDNVIGLSHVYLQRLRRGALWARGLEGMLGEMEPALMNLMSKGGLKDLDDILRLVGPLRRNLGRRLLLNSPASWRLLLRMYEASMPEMSFLDFFWTWRALLGGLFGVALHDLPPARVYHSVSTGYAGLLAARAKLETGRPAILTEHGIYTNERRIEIAMADWLYQAEGRYLGVEKHRRDLRDLWIDTFMSYSRACYEACDRIITLYTGNQEMQRRDGAAEEKLTIIPNGIDFDRYGAIERNDNIGAKEGGRRPRVALIGRVVPIKDVKTFLRAIDRLRNAVPDVEALVMGPTDEDPAYFEECKAMVEHLGLSGVVTFTGRVRLEDHLGSIDAIALTSISEAQPLVILEAGAAGVPTVATDVGACRELIEGRADETPRLGPGGAVTPLSNPTATAEELARLLTNHALLVRCREAIRERVRLYYNKRTLDRIYHDLYMELCDAPDRTPLDPNRSEEAA